MVVVVSEMMLMNHEWEWREIKARKKGAIIQTMGFKRYISRILNEMMLYLILYAFACMHKWKNFWNDCNVVLWKL